MPPSGSSRCNRRSWLRAGVAGAAGWTLAPWAPWAARAEAAARSTADAVLFLNLAGGPSHLDTLDMKPDGPAENRGEFRPIASRIPGLPVCEHLPRIAAAADRLTLLRGISHTTGDHPQGQQYIATGNRPTPALQYPSYGAVVTREFSERAPSRGGSAELPPYVAIPATEWSGGYLGDAYSPFKTNAVPQPGQPFAVRGITLPPGVSLDKVERRQRLLNEIDDGLHGAESPLVEALETFGQQAHRMITSTETRRAFDVSLESAAIRKLFADDELGQSLLLATRLIDHGARFVTVTNQGWDTHLDNFKGHLRLMPPLDHGLIATLDALQAKGLLERTLVIAMGEFGRTPKINQNAGRDHFPRANWCVLAGGGVQPGRLIGGTDAGGERPDDDTDLHPDDIGASIFHALGVDHHKEYYTKTGRPVSLIPHGRVIQELF